MSNVSIRLPRSHVLAVATALAISSMVALPATAAERLNLNALQSSEEQNFDRFIVKYRDGSSQRTSATALGAALKSASSAVPRRAGRALAVHTLRRLAVGAEVIRADRKLDRAEAETFMRQIAADPNVEYVEVDRMLHALVTPNDPRYTDQWHYYQATAGINLPLAWDKSTGAGVVVAVIDTGIAPHSDLDANVVAGYDFISDTFVSRDGNGRDSNPNDEGDWSPVAGECYAGSRISNSSWHGTHVAGTVAAVTNNGNGVAGVAYGARVSPVRVLGRCGGYTSDIADAITWASGGSVSGVPANANPAEVINMSLGGEGVCDTTTQSAINGAVGRGTTIVVAAGNSNNNASNNNPANCANVVTVGAVDSAGARSSWNSTQKSSYGTVVDLAAPGSEIWSTLNAGLQGQGAESYASYGGTSMATPHVAGVVALMQAAAPSPLTPAQVESKLKSTTKPFPTTPSQPIGTGIVDANAAVVSAQGGDTGGGTQIYGNATDYAIGDNATANSPITVSGRTGNGPSAASINVNIVHTYKGDLKVDLVAPDGSLYNLHNRTGGSADNVTGTFTRNLTSEALNGTWNLRVNDNAAGDTGYINSWTITF
ncbi:MAG: S8 family serine peptidase [Pseudoxanthomonas sp.]